MCGRGKKGEEEWRLRSPETEQHLFLQYFKWFEPTFVTLQDNIIQQYITTQAELPSSYFIIWLVPAVTWTHQHSPWRFFYHTASLDRHSTLLQQSQAVTQVTQDLSGGLCSGCQAVCHDKSADSLSGNTII